MITRLPFALAVSMGLVVAQNDTRMQTINPQTKGQEIRGVLMDASCNMIAKRAGSGQPEAAAPATKTQESQSRVNAPASAAPAPVAESRNRSADKPLDVPPPPGDPATSTAFLSVREKYADCVAKPTSTAFAIHDEGKLYVVNQAGNDMIRQQIRNEAFRAGMTDQSGAPKWIGVTGMGVPDGEMLTLTSVRR